MRERQTLKIETAVLSDHEENNTHWCWLFSSIHYIFLKANQTYQVLHYISLSYLTVPVLLLQSPPQPQVSAARRRTQQHLSPGNKNITVKSFRNNPFNERQYRQSVPGCMYQTSATSCNHSFWIRLISFKVPTFRGCSMKMLSKRDRPKDMTHLMDFSLPYWKPYSRVK